MSCVGCKSFVTSKEEKEKRLNICKSCEIRKGVFCGACGCLVAALVTFQNGTCRLNKWQISDSHKV
jgi:hypothetical protein